jgi:Rps23 Pro-64 3,4-dihydroxylase Tpa1-like proline 4-hydroxylase
MQELHPISFSKVQLYDTPFVHFHLPFFLKDNLDSQLFQWFEKTDAWKLTEADFYTQYEFSFFDVDLPEQLRFLKSDNFLEELRKSLANLFAVKSLLLIGVTAHKLINGHKIGIHNDYINGEETHRLLIQINPNWTENNGGFLMLFNSDKSDDISKVIRPLNNSAMGFEISQKSYHAVSTVYNKSRYTVVYTFKQQVC